MLQPGVVLGGIRIDSLLGRGAMGEVYLGQQVSLKRPVAVKRIAEHLLGNEEAIGRFAREAQCVARIQSPHVVAVHDFMRVKDEQGGEHALLVMELVDGGSSLRALLANRGQAFDWRTATALILHAAEGLAAAAEHGVVHRDIKPDNVMVTRKGVAKLADFGLAKSVDSSAMTIEGTVMGTPLYLPPEACRGHAVDARGDLYSLGCTWFHLLTGRPPFQAASTVALLRAHLDDAPPALRGLAPSVPEAVAALVHRLLAKDPEQRLPSAQALVDELHGLAAQGLTIPRVVPEVFTVDAATTVTRVADAAAGATATLPSSAAAPSSSAATLPMASTAATVLAEPTDRVAPPSALTAKVPAKAAEPTPAVAPAVGPAIPPAPAAATGPSSTRQRPVLIVVAVAMLLVAVGAVALLRGGSSPRAQVEQAVALGDYGLALQRATTYLAANPGDAEAVAIVREVVLREVRALIAAGRIEDARKRMADHRATFTWLDTSVLDGEIAIAAAVWLATHGKEKEAIDQFEKLRQGGTDPVALDRAMVESLADGDRPAAAIGAAWRLAEASTSALEPKVLQILTYALTWEGPFGDGIAQLRRLLLKRHPAIVDTVRPWLQDDDYEKRYNAFYLLMDAKALSDAELVSFHLHAVLTLSSSYTIAGESVTWLMTASTQAGWAERRAAAKRPALSEAPPAVKEWNEHATRVITLFASAFLSDYEDAVVRWTTDEDERLRWNAFLVLSEGKRLERIDVPAFHARTLATFNPLYDSPPFNAALGYFAAQAGTPSAAAAKQALTAGIAHVEEQIAGYEKAGGNFMILRANHCRDRLKPIQDVLARF
jgi:serine/threonine-protein kinase